MDARDQGWSDLATSLRTSPFRPLQSGHTHNAGTLAPSTTSVRYWRPQSGQAITRTGTAFSPVACLTLGQGDGIVEQGLHGHILNAAGGCGPF